MISTQRFLQMNIMSVPLGSPGKVVEVLTVVTTRFDKDCNKVKSLESRVSTAVQQQ